MKLILLICAVFVLVGSAHGATLYDDFNDPSHLIRADLWQSFDSYTTGGLASGRPESIRAIDALLAPTQNPRLLLAKRFALSPGGSVGSDFEGLNIRNLETPAGLLTGIQSEVTMLGCVLGQPGFIQAGIEFAAGNDGPSPGTGNRTGDIFARFRISCSAETNQPQITWAVFRCTDAGCTAVTNISGTVSFGSANIGEAYTLHVSKSGTNLVFNALGQTQTFPIPGSGAVPRIFFANVFTRIDPINASLGGEWIIVATFDNVMIDP